MNKFNKSHDDKEVEENSTHHLIIYSKRLLKLCARVLFYLRKFYEHIMNLTLVKRFDHYIVSSSHSRIDSHTSHTPNKTTSKSKIAHVMAFTASGKTLPNRAVNRKERKHGQ